MGLVTSRSRYRHVERVLAEPAVAAGVPERPQCPRCETPTLVEQLRDGIAIDRCRRCEGVWLDRGELDQLVARAATPALPLGTDPFLIPPGLERWA
jgi:ribosomal protein L37AE/L43A